MSYGSAAGILMRKGLLQLPPAGTEAVDDDGKALPLCSIDLLTGESISKANADE
jgi:hypothetical protein